MPPQILPISSERPRRGDRFLIDTNVLLMMFDPTFGSARPRAAMHYANFLGSCKRDGALWFYSALTLAEVATVIERRMVEERLGRRAASDETKRLRREVAFRENFIGRLMTIVTQIDEVAECSDQVFGLAECRALMTLLNESLLDATDAFLVHTYRSGSFNGFVTDDADFATVSRDLIVFTANEKVF